jgi:hypothetical protein
VCVCCLSYGLRKRKENIVCPIHTCITHSHLYNTLSCICAVMILCTDKLYRPILCVCCLSYGLRKRKENIVCPIHTCITHSHLYNTLSCICAVMILCTDKLYRPFGHVGMFNNVVTVFGVTSSCHWLCCRRVGTSHCMLLRYVSMHVCTEPLYYASVCCD